MNKNGKEDVVNLRRLSLSKKTRSILKEAIAFIESFASKQNISKEDGLEMLVNECNLMAFKSCCCESHHSRHWRNNINLSIHQISNDMDIMPSSCCICYNKQNWQCEENISSTYQYLSVNLPCLMELLVHWFNCHTRIFMKETNTS